MDTSQTFLFWGQLIIISSETVTAPLSLFTPNEPVPELTVVPDVASGPRLQSAVPGHMMPHTVNTCC